MLKVIKAAPLPIVLLALSLICPTELSLKLGGLRLPPHRLALIILFVMAVVRLAQSKTVKLMACDYLMAAYGLWSIGVFMYHEGAGPGLQYGGSLALESFASYFVARVYITNLNHVKATVGILVLCVGIVGVIAALEAISHTLIVHSFLKQITGIDVEAGFELRRGLMRAYSTFDHPILYGSFCASTVALAWATTRYTGPAAAKVLGIAAATYFAMSSAPLLCIGVQLGLLFWEQMSRSIPRRAVATIGAIVVALVAVGTFSNRSPFAIIATGFTLDPWTGFYRLMIWTNGLDNVAANPIAGLGLADWKREWWMISDTVDAFWLVVMMRMGIPALVLLVLAITLLLVSIHQQRFGMTKEIRKVVIAWTFSFVAMALAGSTVHYWNNIHAYFFFLLGLMAWVGDPRLGKQRARAFAQAAARQQGPQSAGLQQPAAIRPVIPGTSVPLPTWAAPLPVPVSASPPVAVPASQPRGPFVPASRGKPARDKPASALNDPLAVGTYAVV